MCDRGWRFSTRGGSALWLLLAGLIAAGCPIPTYDDDTTGDDDAADDDAEDPDADGDGYPASVDCDDGDAALNWDDVDLDGWSTCEGDCDDFDSDANPGDADGDGVSSCDGDCDDGSAQTYPGAPEQCDGADNDCDGTVDENVDQDGDGDGFTPCGGDCDDTNANTFPGAEPICDGHTDNDCDGVVDDNESDHDGDGYVPCAGDCDDADADVHPFAADVCDGVPDNDCDGATDPLEADDDGDGTSDCGGDCDDADPAVHPLAAEACNGVDDDCDGIPEADGDGVCGIWTLEAGTQAWAAHALDPAGGSPHAPAAEIEAAFALTDGPAEVWALTATSYHVLDPATLAWTASGSRSSLFPEADGETLFVGWAIPAGYLGGELASIRLLSTSTAWWYTRDPDTGATALEYTGTVDFMGDPLAPDPAQTAGIWLDLYNPHGWVTETNPSPCGGNQSPVAPVYVIVAAGTETVHLYDGGCDEFFATAPAASWSVLAYPGAPAPAVTRATAFTQDTLLLFGP